jgi:hypothetical protein
VQSLVVVIFFLRITRVPAGLLFLPQRGDLEIYLRVIRHVRARIAA